MPHTKPFNFNNNHFETSSSESLPSNDSTDATMKLYNRQSITVNRKLNSYLNSNLKIQMRKNCEGCGKFITDLYHLVIASKFYWHLACLKCHRCGIDLKNKCFIKYGKFYCHEDYYRLNESMYSMLGNTIMNNDLSQSCKSCYKQLNSNDYVIRLNDVYLYHLDCFKCSKCLVKIQPGQKYGLLNDYLFCDKHYSIGSNAVIKIEPNSDQIINNQDLNNNDEIYEKNSESRLKKLLLPSNSVDTGFSDKSNDEEFFYLAPTSITELITPTLSTSSTSSSSSSAASSSSSASMSSNEENFIEYNLDNLRFNFNSILDKNDDYSDCNKNISENESSIIKIDPYCIEDLTIDHIKSKLSSSIQLKQRCLSETTSNIHKCSHIAFKKSSNDNTEGLTGLGTTLGTNTNDSIRPEEILNKQKVIDKVYNENYSTMTNLISLQQRNSSQKKKRMRTSFKHQQLRIMKAYFQSNQNPDSKELKDLSDSTGLSKRTLQVWFQNSRAKQRKTSHQLSSYNSINSKNENTNSSRISNYDYNNDQEEPEPEDDDNIENDEDDNENNTHENDNYDSKKLDTLTTHSICLYNTSELSSSASDNQSSKYQYSNINSLTKKDNNNIIFY